MVAGVLTREFRQHEPDEGVEQEGCENDDAQAAPLVVDARLVGLLQQQLLPNGATSDGVCELRPALGAALQTIVVTARFQECSHRSESTDARWQS